MQKQGRTRYAPATAAMAAVVAGFVSVVALVNPAMAQFRDSEAREGVNNLRGQFDAMRQQIDGLRQSIGTMDGRLGTTEQQVQDKRAIVDLAGQITELRQELSRMRGQIEVLGNQIEQSDKRGRDLYNDVDGRLRRFEQSKVEQQRSVEDDAGKRRAEEARVAEVAAGESRNYEAALNQFKAGNYQSAVAQFQAFMNQYANSRLLASAQYWIGNSYYAVRDYRSAIAAQERVVASWPDDAKAPDALLNIASCRLELGDVNGARATWRAVIDKYPKSSAADQAKQRLARPR